MEKEVVEYINGNISIIVTSHQKFSTSIDGEGVFLGDLIVNAALDDIAVYCDKCDDIIFTGLEGDDFTKPILDHFAEKHQ